MKEKTEKKGHGPQPGVIRREVWLSPELYEKLTNLKVKARIASDAEMIRKLISDGTTIPVMSDDERKAVVDIAHLSTALWLVIKNSRSTGFAEIEKKYTELYRQLAEIFPRLRKKI